VAQFVIRHHLANDFTAIALDIQSDEVVQVNLVLVRLRQFGAWRQQLSIPPAFGLVAVPKSRELHPKASLQRLGHLDAKHALRRCRLALHRAGNECTTRRENQLGARRHRLNDDDAVKPVRPADAPHGNDPVLLIHRHRTSRSEWAFARFAPYSASSAGTGTADD
jgi:hypothetical protein